MACRLPTRNARESFTDEWLTKRRRRFCGGQSALRCTIRLGPAEAGHYRSGNSTRTMSECSRTCSRTSSRPSGEMSKSRISKSGSEIGELLLGPGFQIDQPQILVLKIPSRDHERPLSGHECDVPRAARQHQLGESMRAGIGLHGLDGKRRPDIRPREHDDIAIRRPHGINRVFLPQLRRRSAVDGHAEETRDSVIDGAYRHRLSIGRPRRRRRAARAIA